MQNYDFRFSLFSVVSLRKIILSSGTLIGLFEPQEVRGKNPSIIGSLRHVNCLMKREVEL